MTTEAAPGNVPGTIVANPPAAAPAPAPAEAAAAPTPPAIKEAPTPLPVEGEAGDKAGTFKYESTQHSGLDAALTFVGKHGFGPDSPAMKAAMIGDFTLLRAELAEKGAPGADAYVMLAENAFKELKGKEESRRAEDKAALEKIVGSEENWEAIKDWAKTNAEPDEAEALKTMLGAGGAQMKIAAGFLAGAYQRATGGVPETDGSGPRVADTNGSAAVTTNALSPSDYGREVAKARREFRGEGFEQSPAYRNLAERRSRFKG